MSEENKRGHNAEKGKSGFQPIAVRAPRAPKPSAKAETGKENASSGTENSDVASSAVEDLYNNKFLKVPRSLDDIMLANSSWEQRVAIAKDPISPSLLDKFSRICFDREDYDEEDFDSVLEVLIAVASNKKASPMTLARLAVIDVYDTRLTDVKLAVAANPNTDMQTLSFLMADKELIGRNIEPTTIALVAQDNWLSRLYPVS